MTKVITYGTFGLLNHEHSNVLRCARDLRDLTVALSAEEFTSSKGKKSFHSDNDRTEVLHAIRYVDAVIPETIWGQTLLDVRDQAIDIFVMEDDWAGQFDFLEDHDQVVYLPRTLGVSSSWIKKELANR